MVVERSKLLDIRFEPRRRPGQVTAILGEKGNKRIDRSLLQSNSQQRVAYAEEQQSTVNASVIPFVAAVISKDSAEMISTKFGVGFQVIDKAKTIFWGLPDAQTPIHAWRAVHFLEATPHIRPSTLEAAWHVAGQDIDRTDKQVATFIEDIGSDRFEAIRTKILGTAPSTEEMRRMFVQFNLAGVKADFAEWEQEVAAGRMPDDGGVQGYYEQNEAFLEECEKNESEYRKHNASVS